MDYYNFLEGLVRVCKARPWSAEDEAELPHFDDKLQKICNLLEDRYYEELNEMFNAQRENFEHERRYQPRIVVADDDDDGGSDDDEMP